jgi:hypothetical protein
MAHGGKNIKKRGIKGGNEKEKEKRINTNPETEQ